jgi:hypothetical protein
MDINPDTFANLVVTEAMDTVSAQVPAGDRPMYIKAQKLRQQKEYWLLDLTCVVTDQESISETGKDEPTVRGSIFLDFTPEGGLDFGKGKNVQLGKLREACSQNQKGKPWSPGMLVGASVIGHVSHRIDKNGNPQAEVKSFAKA